MRSRAHQLLLVLTAGVLVALAACTDTGAGLVIVFPDEASKTEATTLDLFVLHRTPDADLCAALTRSSQPLPPTDPSLVHDASLEDVPVGDVLAGAGAMLSDLPSGERVFYARVKDRGGAYFLRGCAQGVLEGGGRVEVLLTRRAGPGVDAAPDAMVDAAPLPPDALVVPPDLTVIVTQTDNPTVAIPDALVVVDDGTAAPLTATTDSSGRVVFTDVSGLARPFDVTVAGDVTDAGVVYRAATTLLAIAPPLSGGGYLVRAPLETAPAATNITGSMRGAVTGVPADGSTATIVARTPLLGPYAQEASGGAYTIAGLTAPQTYSAALLVRDAASTLQRVAVSLTVALGSSPASDVVVNYDHAAAAPVNVPTTLTLGASPAGLVGASRTFVHSLFLPRGPIELLSVANPTSPLAISSPDLSALAMGTVLLYQLRAVDPAARVTGEVSGEILTAASPLSLTLSLPGPPTITAPTSGASFTVAETGTLELVFGGLFTGHQLVHARIEGAAGSMRYRWNVIAPPRTASLTLPSLPAERTLFAAGTAYDLTLTAQRAVGTFSYERNVAADFAITTRAANAPQRASHALSFTVTP